MNLSKNAFIVIFAWIIIMSSTSIANQKNAKLKKKKIDMICMSVKTVIIYII